MKIRAELIEKAKLAKNPEELLLMASENEFEMTEEEAVEYFQKLNPKTGVLSDGELDNVAGGGCGLTYLSCPKCGSTDVQYQYGGLYKVTKGDKVSAVQMNYYNCSKCGHTFHS